MDKLKLAELSALKFSDDEILEFSEDFSNICSLVDKINEFKYTGNKKNTTCDFSDLREDIKENHDFKIETKTVPRVVS